jgi:D-alanyl-D-alanine carboxypeptidase
LIDRIHANLGITPALLEGRMLLQYEEAQGLVPAEKAPNGRVHFLLSEAAEAWRAMQEAAHSDGVDIHILSGFRSVARQGELIQVRLDGGMAIEDVLKILAPPGYSEHHTGRAVDVSTQGVKTLQIEFESTPAFTWLSGHAGRFGFILSFPRDNPAGYDYEPWHWCYCGR